MLGPCRHCTWTQPAREKQMDFPSELNRLLFVTRAGTVFIGAGIRATLINAFRCPKQWKNAEVLWVQQHYVIRVRSEHTTVRGPRVMLFCEIVVASDALLQDQFWNAKYDLVWRYTWSKKLTQVDCIQFALSFIINI